MTLPGGCVCVLSHFSRVWLCATLWTMAWQVPLALHGILQARTLEWMTTSFSRGSSQRRDRTHVSKSPALAGGFFTTEPPLVPRHHYTYWLALWGHSLAPQSSSGWRTWAQGFSNRNMSHTNTACNTVEGRKENDSHFTFYSNPSACLHKFSDDFSTLILYIEFLTLPST